MLPSRRVYGIVGSREWKDYEGLCLFVDEAIRVHGPPAAFVSGGADGADKMGERYAKERYGMETVIQDHACETVTEGAMNVFLPDWSSSAGRFAGLARNVLIAKFCDVLVALPTKESRGTYHTIGQAKARGKVVVVAATE